MRLMDIAIVGYGSAGSLHDLLFQPLGMLPGGRLQMLRILTGTRSGWLGQWHLPQGFAEALARA